jgi:hypothetical protein
MKPTMLKQTGVGRRSLTAIILAIGLFTILLPLLWPATQAGNGIASTDLPVPRRDSLHIPQGNRLEFCMYALGVQLYRWTGTSWDFVSPTAMLFGNADSQRD